MRFVNRAEAARRLADRLAPYRVQRPLVLGVPRGGVPMARIVADALDADLDVVLVRKIGAPGQPELAIGAVDERGAVLHGAYYDLATDAYVQEEIRRQQEVIARRRAMIARVQPPIDPAGRVVIVVDDGLATGSSMLAAVQALRARTPARIVVAVGVAPPSTLSRLERLADEVVCLHTSGAFAAVGQFYDDFSEVTDDMVLDALRRAPRTRADAASPESGGGLQGLGT